MKKIILWTMYVSLACCLGFTRNESRYPDANLSHIGDASYVVRGAYSKHFSLSLAVGLDPTFSDSQTRTIKNALKILIDRALSDRVIDCAFAHSSKDEPSSKTEFKRQLFSAFSFLNVGENIMPCLAFIARYWDDPKTVGIGYVGIFNDRDKPFPGYTDRHYLHIAINSDHLGEDSKYPWNEDEAYWAGVIAHEFLHNLGYRHPTGYPGSFVYEYGRCVQSNGLEAAPIEGELFDKEVEKEL